MLNFKILNKDQNTDYNMDIIVWTRIVVFYHNILNNEVFSFPG